MLGDELVYTSFIPVNVKGISCCSKVDDNDVYTSSSSRHKIRMIQRLTKADTF